VPFGLGLAVGNGLFTGAHFALGMAIGPSAASVLGGLGVAMVVIVAVLAIVGLVGWRVIGERSSARQSGLTSPERDLCSESARLPGQEAAEAAMSAS
jgi:hypothetical protein